MVGKLAILFDLRDTKAVPGLRLRLYSNRQRYHDFYFGSEHVER